MGIDINERHTHTHTHTHTRAVERWSVGIVDLDEGSVCRVDLGVLCGACIILPCPHFPYLKFPLSRIRAFKIEGPP